MVSVSASWSMLIMAVGTMSLVHRHELSGQALV